MCIKYDILIKKLIVGFMLDFINSAFKGLFTFIVWVLMIIVIIGGFLVITTSPLISFLIWIGGLIIIILSAGLVSMLIKMNENLQLIIDHGIFLNKTGTYANSTGNVNIQGFKYYDNNVDFQNINENSIKIKSRIRLTEEPDNNSKFIINLTSGEIVTLIGKIEADNFISYNVKDKNNKKGWFIVNKNMKTKLRHITHDKNHVSITAVWFSFS